MLANLYYDCKKFNLNCDLVMFRPWLLFEKTLIIKTQELEIGHLCKREAEFKSITSTLLLGVLDI